MTVRIRSLTFDCNDAHGLATFWARLLDWHVISDDDPEVMVAPHYPFDGQSLLFIPVPEGKTAKNRVHLDLEPTDRTREEEVARALELGATLVDDRREADGTGWAVLADPEGNELCILRSAAERAAGAPAGPASPTTITIG